MPRLPPSLKWLIDRRARVAGEIEKIESSLAKCQRLADEIALLKQMLASIDQTLSLHDISIDVTLIRSIKSQYVRLNLPHGALTRAILHCLKENSDAPCTTDAVTAFVAARHESLRGEETSVADLRQSVRYRLKDLCRQQLVERHHDPVWPEIGLWSLKENGPDT